MNTEAIDRTISSSRGFFFTDVFLLVCMVLAITSILFSRRKGKFYVLFLCYCLAGFALILSGRMVNFFFKKNESSVLFIEGGNIFFALLEYITFYYFFKDLLQSGSVKLFMLVAFYFLIATGLFFLYQVVVPGISDNTIYQFSDFITTGELVILAALCLKYFFELLRKRPIFDLFKSPSFWIVTSLFFYAIIVTPFFLILSDEFRTNYKPVYDAFFALHFVSFSFLFIAIANAFLCKGPLTT